MTHEEIFDQVYNEILAAVNDLRKDGIVCSPPLNLKIEKL